jgi:PAS domain-containing protein
MVSNQTQNASQASEQRYLHLFENLPVCIFIVDLTVTPPVILQANKRTEVVFGYTEVALLVSDSRDLPERLPCAEVGFVRHLHSSAGRAAKFKVGR